MHLRRAFSSCRRSARYPSSKKKFPKDLSGLFGRQARKRAKLQPWETFSASSSKHAGMRVAVEGCAHGELSTIYDSIAYMEQKESIKIDLLLICGDFQAVRNENDLACLACPPKYRRMNSFFKYYSGELTAPIPTIFIGGNHEASNYLFELYHGGWVAPNMYFLGHSGVVNFGGLRIGGLSGIFNSAHYNLGYYEQFPLKAGDIRSIYHVRLFEIFKLMQLSGHMDVFLTHDWPRGIAQHGDIPHLLHRKKFLAKEVQTNTLGNPETESLLKKLQPSYWFSAHLHVKFPAVVRHSNESLTRFLALDKCLPQRDFLQVVEFPQASGPLEFSYDREWLAITQLTYEFLSTSRNPPPLPLPGSVREDQRTDFCPTMEELESVSKAFGDLKIPLNFKKTAMGHNSSKNRRGQSQPLQSNPQTEQLLSKLGLQDAFACKRQSGGPTGAPAAVDPNPEEINLDMDDDSEDNMDGAAVAPATDATVHSALALDATSLSVPALDASATPPQDPPTSTRSPMLLPPPSH